MLVIDRFDARGSQPVMTLLDELIGEAEAIEIDEGPRARRRNSLYEAAQRVRRNSNAEVQGCVGGAGEGGEERAGLRVSMSEETASTRQQREEQPSFRRSTGEDSARLSWEGDDAKVRLKMSMTVPSKDHDEPGSITL